MSATPVPDTIVPRLLKEGATGNAPSLASGLFSQVLAQATGGSLPSNATLGTMPTTNMPQFTVTFPEVMGQLSLPVGAGGRQGRGTINNAELYMVPGNTGDFTIDFNFNQPVVSQVGNRLERSIRLRLTENGVSSEAGFEEGGKLLKALVDSVGGVDAFMSLVSELGRVSSERAVAFNPQDLPAMRAGIERSIAAAERALTFEQQSTAPAAGGERVVWNAMQLEQDPARLNALLDRLGNQYGVRGGARPWTEWLNDTTEIPVAQTLIDTAARFDDVVPEALATVLFGEGAGFFDINDLGDDYGEFNNSPRNGFTYYGLDTFADMVPELMRKGYLPADFQFETIQEENELGQTVNSAEFRNFEDTVLAAGAVWQHHVDMADAMMTRVFGRVPSNPETRFFYTYALFNAGPRDAERMMRARGENYTPRWDGSERPGNAQDNAVYNATVRAMQLRFFQETGVFN